MNKIYVISGPSGVGKGTIAKQILAKNGNLTLSVSCTTRYMREGETRGKDYFFISKEEFEKKIQNDEFLEYDNHFETYYGTPKDFVFDKLKTGDVLLEIDVNGALKVKKNYPDAVLIFIMPPSTDELKRRLIARNTETFDKIEGRLARVEEEIKKSDKFDFIVVNDVLSQAVTEVMDIIKRK